MAELGRRDRWAAQPRPLAPNCVPFFVSQKFARPLTTHSTDHRSDYRGRAYANATGAHDAPIQKRGTGRPLTTVLMALGIAPATTKIGLANLVQNIKRLIFLRRAVVA